ncbi:MAG: trehalase-like domain-containing protein, partial [Terracoccus sp.]
MTWRPGAAVVPQRIDGYAPIEQYAAIGDGRTVALVAADGAIDWWCLPDIDGAAVCWSLLDADSGGRFTLAPTTAHTVSRRYVPNTNVLETTFTTATGAV